MLGTSEDMLANLAWADQAKRPTVYATRIVALRCASDEVNLPDW